MLACILLRENIAYSALMISRDGKTLWIPVLMLILISTFIDFALIHLGNIDTTYKEQLFCDFLEK